MKEANMKSKLKIKKMAWRYFAVICGAGTLIALHAATSKAPLTQLGLDDALMFLALNATLGLTLWGMLASSAQSGTKLMSTRLAEAGPTIAGASILLGWLWIAEGGALLPLWFLALLVVPVLSRLLVGRFLATGR